MTYTGTVHADHHQFVVGSPSAETYEPAATGSVIEVGPNFVTVMTGVAYGPVSVTIELLVTDPGDPSTSGEWEVIEEATIKVSEPFRVLTMGGEVAQDFPTLPIPKGLNTFRVSGRGRDANWDLTVTDPTESHLVQIWRVAKTAAMRRLHKTDTAWNDDIIVHKVRNWWDPDPVADATMYIKYGYEQMARSVKQNAIDWGGRPPTDKIARVPYAQQFAGHDRMLVDAMARARAPKLRTIAAWRAYMIAGVADIDWIREGLDAFDHGPPLPVPFDDRHSTKVWDAFNGDTRIHLWETSDSGDQFSTAALVSVNALTDASGSEPLSALFNALYTLAQVQARVDVPGQVLLQSQDYDYPKIIADLRREFFPKLAPADQYERWIGHTVDDVLQANPGR
ncbi:transposase [Rhodococcus sp. Eu-32]|uniref:transposase n=1 Tax=Rhodococcus sp. Eu-32 TaxID=1017319 RepID=UPI000DF46663|nr:transposase [Rhodococcus sp. Eu-32]RRQ29693.1 transposase [Rhodococcus sp. Eu-32]